MGPPKKLLWLFLAVLLVGAVADEELKSKEEVEIADSSDKEAKVEPPPEEDVEQVEPVNHPKDIPDDKPIEAEKEAEEKTPAKTPIKATERSGKLIANYDYTNYDSLTSRIEPPRDQGIPVPLTEQRLKQIREPLMYWYFDQGGDEDKGDWQENIHGSSVTVTKSLGFQLPFFGFRYNYTRISVNGYFEFSDPPPQYKSYPLTFPSKDWPKENDPAFIAIFMSKMRIGLLRDHEVEKQQKPGVYFRIVQDLQTKNDSFRQEVRERVKWDIREGIIGSETFDPKHVIIATWKNVSFVGGHPNALYTTNTFQIVLATDEVYTYAIFNYADIQWTTHTEALGDHIKGDGGTPAFVGFNAGNGTRSWSYWPYSQRSPVRDLTGRGWGNEKKGRHIFRIDENIITGTCNKDISGANLDLIFAPESGNMLGGTVVNITGPCFRPTDKITCKFDTEEVRGAVVNRNRAVCVLPRGVQGDGYVRFEVKIGNGPYNWKGKFFLETPATAAERIFFEDNSVYEKNPKEIKITWEKGNLTTNLNAPVRISLWGYREIEKYPDFVYIDSLEESVSNTGVHTISPGAYRNRENLQTSDIKFGFIQINLTDSQNLNGLEIVPVIWSRPIPLGWYFGPQWEREYGKNWPDRLCSEWLMNDRNKRNFAHELPQCPCTLDQALLDKGRFLPDFDCDKDANPSCMYHKGALHCVRSGAPDLNTGSEQQCCYDKNKYLMLSYDQQWGSRPRRSHNLGYTPWNEANKIPTLSQWFNDMVPYFTCCAWQEEQSVGCETFRFERRPTQDCVAYQPPGVATVFGDPHIVTFDGHEYTFNGKGEFVLTRVKTDKLRLDVQGRFEQLPQNAYGDVRATQLTAIAAQGNNSAIIEVRVRPTHSQWRYRLDVFADKKRVYFDRPALKFQHFPGVTVYTPTYILNQSEVVIMFESGAGVEVVENKGYMTARVYLPWNFINKTMGLFGNWSFDIQDDYVLPDGTRAAVTNNINDFERVHRDFGIHWMLDDKDVPNVGRALFLREFSRQSSYYTNKTFEPIWKKTPYEIIPENRTIDRQKAYELCGDIYQCQYDYAMSLNRDMAHFTKNYLNTYTQIVEETKKRIVSCGVLETPRFGRKSNFLFVPGTTVSFECNQNFMLIGDPRRTCNHDGRWNIPDYGYTECLRMVEYESRTAGITAAIVLSIMLPLVSLIVWIGYCFWNKDGKESMISWVFTQPRSRSNSRLRLDSRQISPELSPQPFDSPNSPFGDPSNPGSMKKRRSYEKVYRTNEPLEGKPDIEWDDKEWDVSSGEGSEYVPPNNKTGDYGKPKAGRLYSDPEFTYAEEEDGTDIDEVRSGTIDSGIAINNRPYTMYVPQKPRHKYDPNQSNSQPNLLNDVEYSTIDKSKKAPHPAQFEQQPPVRSMSSRITSV